MSNDTTAAEKPVLHYSQVGEDCHDPYNGIVAVFEDLEAAGEARYWAEHQRKDIYTDFVTLPEALAAAEEFVNDTVF